MKLFEKNTYTAGFTIVELLIIVAVIAILASITIVSYNAVTNNSRQQAVATDLQAVSTELTKFKSENGTFPTPTVFTSDISKANSSGQTVFTYGYNSATGVYCLRAIAYGKSFYLTSKNSTVVEGACPVGY